MYQKSAIYLKVKPSLIKSIVHPGTISKKTQFKEDVNITPILSVFHQIDNHTYHVFVTEDINDTPVYYVAKQFKPGIVYQPEQISQKMFHNILKSFNSELLVDTEV